MVLNDDATSASAEGILFVVIFLLSLFLKFAPRYKWAAGFVRESGT